MSADALAPKVPSASAGMVRAEVKYVSSNTNINTFFYSVSNTNTNMMTKTGPNKNTAHQVQIKIQIEAETKWTLFCRKHFQIHFIV